MAALLAGKTCIITGNSSGIGLATAIACLRHGAKVLGVDIMPEHPSLAAKRNWHFLQVELTDDAAPHHVVTQTVERFGPRVDLLANVAGVMDNFGSLDSLTDANLQRCLAVNVAAPIRLSRAVIENMRHHRSGSIVNVASKVGSSGGASGIAYTASKHAIVGATKQVAWWYRNEGIRCNAVAPGGTQSCTNGGMAAALDFSKIDTEAFKALEPVLYAHTPDLSKPVPIDVSDVAYAIVFLASDASKKISGAVIPIDQAWSTI